MRGCKPGTTALERGAEVHKFDRCHERAEPHPDAIFFGSLFNDAYAPRKRSGEDPHPFALIKREGDVAVDGLRGSTPSKRTWQHRPRCEHIPASERVERAPLARTALSPLKLTCRRAARGCARRYSPFGIGLRDGTPRILTFTSRAFFARRFVSVLGATLSSLLAASLPALLDPRGATLPPRPTTVCRDEVVVGRPR